MAAKDKYGRAFEVGKHVKVASSGQYTVTPINGVPYVVDGHPGGDNPKGDYEGEIVGVHEDGPHVKLKDGSRRTPFAAECEVLGGE